MKVSKRFVTIPLAITIAAAGIFLLVGLGSATVEARGRNITVTRNDIVIPGNTTCLNSLVEWEPVGSKVEVEFLLQARSGRLQNWTIIDSNTQLLPGKAKGATVDWPRVTPGNQYRHLFRMYSVKGKDGRTRNHQLSNDFSTQVSEAATCPG